MRSEVFVNLFHCRRN